MNHTETAPRPTPENFAGIMERLARGIDAADLNGVSFSATSIETRQILSQPASMIPSARKVRPVAQIKSADAAGSKIMSDGHELSYEQALRRHRRRDPIKALDSVIANKPVDARRSGQDAPKPVSSDPEDFRPAQPKVMRTSNNSGAKTLPGAKRKDGGDEKAIRRRAAKPSASAKQTGTAAGKISRVDVDSRLDTSPAFLPLKSRAGKKPAAVGNQAGGRACGQGVGHHFRQGCGTCCG